MRGEQVEELVDRIDAVAADCERIINDIARPAFADLQSVFGTPMVSLLEQMLAVDLDSIEDGALLRLARSIVPAT
jgi:hypothetical protein